MVAKKSRILIVEDHPIFRMGITELINQNEDLMVCGNAEDVPGARQCIETLKPDLVIIDLALKGVSGIELVSEIRRNHKKISTLVLSMYDESLHAERCLMAGAGGYVMKHEASESVIKAIRQILSGKIYVSQTILTNIIDTLQNKPEAIHKSPLQRLTDREMEIFQHIGRGLASGEIAKQLNLSVKTVGTHRERIKQKLGLRHGSELVRYSVLWVETGLIPT